MTTLDEIEERYGWRKHDDDTWPEYLPVQGSDFNFLLAVARAAEKALHHHSECDRCYPELRNSLKSLSEVK